MTRDAEWTIENLQYEINRVRSVLRSPGLAAAEREIAEAQLQNYRDLLDRAGLLSKTMG